MDKVLSVIPEIFYDLIGRVAPGALVLIAAVAAWFGPTQTLEAAPAWLARSSGNFWPYALLLLLFSYLTGVVLVALWNWLRTLGRKPRVEPAVQKWTEQFFVLMTQQKPKNELYVKKWTQKLFGLLTRHLQNRPPGWYELGVLERIVGMRQPSQAYRLQKLSAERSFCKVIVSGFLLGLVLALISTRWTLFSYGSLFLIGGMILSMLGCSFWLKALRTTRDADLCILASLLELPELSGEGEEARKAA